MPHIPRLETVGAATQLIVDDAPFIVLGGQVHNSSSSSLAYMDSKVWDRVAALNCNTAILPVYWELIEPVEGAFDFSLVDGLLEGARARGLRLILLWFGTWKNTHSTYAPAWVKTDLQRFPRAQKRAGENSGTISCLATAARDADARAFAAFMRHLGNVDRDHRTVIMVQVQNETGLLQASREHSEAANAAFAKDVPQVLLDHVSRNVDTLHPAFRALWQAAGSRTSGTWSEVFGTGADETFMAWHIATYVETIAAAGAREYPLPLFTNTWLVSEPGEEPGSYPSGGPVSRMMDVWHLAAPHIFTLAPDIYSPDFVNICADYHRGDNPLLIPETTRECTLGPKCLYAIGRHSALCFAPFGIESIDSPDVVYVEGPVVDGSVKYTEYGVGDVLSKTYRVLRSLMPLITKYQGTGAVTGFLQQDSDEAFIEFGGYRLRIRYTDIANDSLMPGGGIVINTAPDAFVVAGVRCQIDFIMPEGSDRTVEYLALDEGEYVDGEWRQLRRLNGDERALRLLNEPVIRRVLLHNFTINGKD